MYFMQFSVTKDKTVITGLEKYLHMLFHKLCQFSLISFLTSDIIDYKILMIYFDSLIISK